MALTPQEAAQSLEEAHRSARRSAQAFGYRMAAPHLILWGVVWMIGYTASDLWPQYSTWAWAVLIVLALIIGPLIARRFAPANMQKGAANLRFLALIPVTGVFIAAMFAVMRPDPMQQAAFFPILIATVYASLGIWMGIRYVVAGTVLMALTLGGFFYLHDHFALWMAVCGGGALVLAGIWFLRA